MKYKEIDYNKAFKILDELLNKYDIPNKLSQDGITKIDGMSIDEYFDKVGLFNNLNQERDNNMHVDVLVKIENGKNELYPSDLAEDILVNYINDRIDYFDDVKKEYTYKQIFDMKQELEYQVYAYIDNVNGWIQEPTLETINYILKESNDNDLFYIVDCHI